MSSHEFVQTSAFLEVWQAQNALGISIINVKWYAPHAINEDIL